MIEFFTDPFSTELARSALVQLLLLSPLLAITGTWTVLMRQSFTADALNHSLLPGLALALAAGLPLAVGGFVGIAVAGLVLLLATNGRGVNTGTTVAVVAMSLLGLGTLLSLQLNVNTSVEELLFGNVLAVQTSDLVATGCALAVALSIALIWHRDLALYTAQPAIANSLGISETKAKFILYSLLTVTVGVSIQSLGALLTTALLIAPFAAALKTTRGVSRVAVVAALLTILSAVFGVIGSYHLDTAVGGTVALTAITIYLLVVTGTSVLRAKARRQL